MILDTNALSAMADGDKRLEVVLQEASRIAIPAIVLGEYKFGIRQSRNRKVYERWLAELAEVAQVLAVDEDTADRYAEVRGELKQAGRPIPGNDVWIAALVRQYSLPLLSRDCHFDSVPGLKRINW